VLRPVLSRHLLIDLCATHTWRSRLRGLVLLFCAVPCLAAQTNSEASYQAKRERAEQLFDAGKRLEALPLLEELVRSRPEDDAMLVALAASLIDHAATLTDTQAAGNERLRARSLLDKARDLGNTSTLAMNLSQLLQQLPATGSIKFSNNPQVQRFMEAGEAAFSRRDLDGALSNYFKALELEPANSSAALFIANTYDKRDEFAKAAEWYERAAELEPNVETPYRYYADMLAREGEMGKARTMLIHAAVAEPYNRIVWRELQAWATLNHTEIRAVYITIPAAANDTGAPINQPRTAQPDAILPAWDVYQAVKAKWQQGGEFHKRFSEEKEYRHTLAEESEALTAAAQVLEKLGEKTTAELIASDDDAHLLLTLHRAQLIEPYVLFSLGDAGIARDYSAYRASHRKKLEEYLDKFVVPPVR
jgi:tetratricopeptide (TPR) repeat protein